MISVILPVFNSVKYILASVNSILNQSFSDFELIIIDDGSTDGSYEILTSISDPRIRLVRNEKNIGLVDSLNLGLQLAKGVYIARMDHDDISLPLRLEKQFRFLSSNSNIGVLGTGYQLIDQLGRRGHVYQQPSSHEEIAWAMSFLCPIAHPTVMFRSSIIWNEPAYLKLASYAEDYELWERLSLKYNFANLPEPLLLLRKHERNMTNIWSKEGFDIASTISKRRVEKALGRSVSYQNISCLYSQGRLNRDRALACSVLIIELLKVYRNENIHVSTNVLCDAAKRILLMGLRSRNVWTVMLCLAKSLRITTKFIKPLVLNAYIRLSGNGIIKIIG
ncbi:glycosyltransferase [Polynucleobacter sp. MWH-Braz-FAM2G]|uniref:glycosyltransferase n=1 Tax=Polynucleobacter sp. MWH-Braz-FAM2G TaxID=1855883 RepID=UPI001BFE204A|nr:glycosyltransferase [Polynucleobacter sp. MWH-Braz-FAM2G]QWD91101.1 glycosyltransferase [Polynucleobacter sp. MWH-Braz-FAM2G]